MFSLADISSNYRPRFAEFAFEPAFVAMVDQHAADVRARLGADGPELTPTAPDAERLADYSLGFLDALTEIDWREPVGYDYAVCRLTAISWLVHAHGLLPEPRD